MLTGGAGEVTITAVAGPGEANTASNLGAGAGTFAAKIGVDLQFKSLVAGAGVGLSSTATEVTVTSTGTNVSLASAGGAETLIQDGSGPALGTKGLTAGAGITLTGAANEVTIAATGEANTASNLGSTGGRVGIFAAKVGTDLQFRSLVSAGAVTITADSPAGGEIEIGGGGGGLLSHPWHIIDAKTTGVNGGSYPVANTWVTRDLNAISGNSELEVQLAVAPAGANQLLVAPGNYWIFGSAPAAGVSGHKARVRNITTGADAVDGSSEHTRSTGAVNQITGTRSFFAGGFTISGGSPQVLEVQHFGQALRTNVGLGNSTGAPGVLEVYTIIDILRIL